jgi:hypothetical protein
MAGKTSGMRGQIFSTEMMVTFSIFLGALIIFLFVWNTLYNNYLEEQYDTNMQVVLIGISDAAVMSQGDPASWDITSGMNANSYGFASSRNVLSPSKLYAMQGYFATDYADMKYKMGAGGYGIFMDVKDTGGNTYYSFGSMADTANESISAVSAERLALMDNALVKLRVQLWRVRGRSI